MKNICPCFRSAKVSIGLLPNVFITSNVTCFVMSHADVAKSRDSMDLEIYIKILKMFKNLQHKFFKDIQVWFLHYN